MQIQKPKQGYNLVKSLFGTYEEIPSDWELSKIKNHVEILVGHSFSSSEYSDNPNDIKLIRGDNVTEGKIRWEDKTRYWKNSSGLEKYLLREEDFVISMDGSKVGRNYAYVTKNDVPSLLLQRVARLRTKDTLTQKYLGYIFGNQNFINYVNSIKTNAAIPHISQTQIENFEFILPPLKEQQKIASILSNVDSLIQQTQKEIEQIQKLKKGLMQKLLTKGIGYTKFKKVNFGGQIFETIPENWEIKNLGEVSKNGTQNGLAISISDYGAGVPIVGMTKFYASEILTLDNMKEVDISKRDIEKFSLKPFDLLFGRRSMDGKATGGAGKCIVVPKINKTIVFESSIIRMSVKDEVDPFFIYHLLKSNMGEKIMRRIIRVSAVSGISSGDLVKIKIPIPPKEEQKRIVSILSENDDYTNKLEENKLKFQSLKKGLMQKLLTGQIRVKT